jgi:hypothetical protein
LAETSDQMHRAIDDWRTCLVVFELAFEIQRQNNIREYRGADLEKIHCLDDLVVATEPMLIDVPEPGRRTASVDAVRNAFDAVFPDVACPPPSARLADALRPHRHKLKFLARRSD